MSQEKGIHIDQRYIEGIKHNDNLVIGEIYKRYAPKIKNWVLTNSGSIADAGDLFQEALITVFHQATEKGLKLTCPFEAYLLLLVKRKWFNELKRKGRRGVTIRPEEVSTIGTDTFKELEETIAQEEKENQVMKLLNTLGESCRKIIRSCLKKGISQEEVAEKLGISYAYLRKKKSQCMAKLIEKVKSSNIKY